MKKDYTDRSDTWRMGLWVYEVDIQESGVLVYKSEMVWPTEEHEDVYICLGESQTTPSADKRCLLTNMTVVFTERFYKEQRRTKEGSMVKLPVTGFNSHLSAETIDDKSDLCYAACIFGAMAMWFGYSIIGLLLLVVLCVIVEKCYKRCKDNQQASSESQSLPPQGKSHLTLPGMKLHCIHWADSSLSS